MHNTQIQIYWAVKPEMSEEDLEACSRIGCTATRADIFGLEGGGVWPSLRRSPGLKSTGLSAWPS